MPSQQCELDPRDVLDLLEDQGLLIIHPKQIIGRSVFAKLLGCSENTIDNRANPDHKGHDPRFPEKRKKGENSVGWLAGEAFDYIDALPKIASERNCKTKGGKRKNER